MPREGTILKDALRLKLKDRTGHHVRVEGMYCGDFVGTITAPGFSGCEFRVDEPLSQHEEAPKAGDVIWLAYSAQMRILESDGTDPDKPETPAETFKV